MKATLIIINRYAARPKRPRRLVTAVFGKNRREVMAVAEASARDLELMRRVETDQRSVLFAGEQGCGRVAAREYPLDRISVLPHLPVVRRQRRPDRRAVKRDPRPELFERRNRRGVPHQVIQPTPSEAQ